VAALILAEVKTTEVLSLAEVRPFVVFLCWGDGIDREGK
jgi:hypothetical protein